MTKKKQIKRMNIPPLLCRDIYFNSMQEKLNNMEDKEYRDAIHTKHKTNQ